LGLRCTLATQTANILRSYIICRVVEIFPAVIIFSGLKKKTLFHISA